MRRCVLLWIVLAVLPAGCASEVPSREGAGQGGDRSGGTLRVGVAMELTEPSPLSENNFGALIQELVFGSLVREDRPGAPEGDLARSWTWSPDGRRR